MPVIGEIRKGRELGYKSKARYIWLACPKCGKERWIFCSSIKEPSFTGLCPHCYQCGERPNTRGENSPSWKGGHRKIPEGYIQIWLPRNDFFRPMANKQGYILEHRLVMAQYLRRHLLAWEVVHHKNGVKDDNRLENLELLTIKTHTVDSQIKSKLKQLEKRVTQLEAENVLLRAQLGVRINP